MRYESRKHRPVRGWRFAQRMARHGVLAAAFVACSLLGGMYGYHRFEHLGWRKSYLNASMILGGMGPVDSLTTPQGEIFAGTYALYSGLVFLVVVGLIGAPVVHRLLHELQWDDGD